MDALSRAASYWDKTVATHFRNGTNTNRAEWQAHPIVQARRNRLLGGSASDWLASRLHAKVGRALGAGCGAASFELELLQRGAVEHFDLWDVSPAFLELAQEHAEDLGLTDRVTVHCGDVFSVDQRNYDLVTFVHSLHHALDVRSAVRFAHDVLESGGLLFADEYIGPRRFAYPDEHSALVKALYRSLNTGLRGPWPELPQPNPSDVEKADATESAESDLIVGAIHETFADVEMVQLFGALPFILWWGLNHDALWDSELGQNFVETLLEIDEALARSGRLPSYFGVLLARRN